MDWINCGRAEGSEDGGANAGGTVVVDRDAGVEVVLGEGRFDTVLLRLAEYAEGGEVKSSADGSSAEQAASNQDRYLLTVVGCCWEV